MREVYNAPAVAGQLIKFSVNSLGSIIVTNKNLTGDPFTMTLMGMRRAFDGGDIRGAFDDDFIDLAPNILFTVDDNYAVATPGHYALRSDVDGLFTVLINDSSDEENVVDPIQAALDRVLTQYRESPNLLGLIAVYLRQIESVKDVIRGMPEDFNLDTATGDQLTILGKWLGFPRCHNVPSTVPVFGFDCPEYVGPYTLGGFCEGSLWLGCPGIASFEVCIEDDELYRRFLYVRRYQLLGMNDFRSFVTCIRILFGSASSFSIAGRIITVLPGRALTDYENIFLKVFERVLPCAPSSSVVVTP